MATKRILFPSLSESGWLNSTVQTVDALLSHFFCSDRSQSYIYPTSISSLPWILQDTQGDMSQTIAATRTTLSGYFSKYFNNVVVEVAEVLNEAEPSKGAISIYIKFTDADGKEHNVGKMLQITDTTISKIIELNNG